MRNRKQTPRHQHPKRHIRRRSQVDPVRKSMLIAKEIHPTKRRNGTLIERHGPQQNHRKQIHDQHHRSPNHRRIDLRIPRHQVPGNQHRQQDIRSRPGIHQRRKMTHVRQPVHPIERLVGTLDRVHASLPCNRAFWSGERGKTKPVCKSGSSLKLDSRSDWKEA
jgi:hypothetical protein